MSSTEWLAALLAVVAWSLPFLAAWDAQRVSKLERKRVDVLASELVSERELMRSNLQCIVNRINNLERRPWCSKGVCP